MNRCLRSLSCLLTLIALALCATNAAARTNPKQQHAKKALETKAPEKKTHEKKLHTAKEARPHRNAAVEKRRHAKHADAKKTRAKDAAAAPLSLGGRDVEASIAGPMSFQERRKRGTFSPQLLQGRTSNATCDSMARREIGRASCRERV